MGSTVYFLLWVMQNFFIITVFFNRLGMVLDLNAIMVVYMEPLGNIPSAMAGSSR